MIRVRPARGQATRALANTEGMNERFVSDSLASLTGILSFEMVLVAQRCQPDSSKPARVHMVSAIRLSSTRQASVV